MAKTKVFLVRQALDWLEKKHLFLELFEPTGYFLKQQDTRVEIQYYVDPLNVARTTLLAAIKHANEMEGKHISGRKLLIFNRKSMIFTAENLAVTPVVEKELEWLLNTLANRKAKDPEYAVSMILVLEVRTNDIG